MDKNIFIAGDWGTSVLRLYLCRDDQILETADGPGIAKIAGDHGDVLWGLIKSWSQKYGFVPIYLSGMVGSNIGWINTDYSQCPTTKLTLCHELTNIKHQGHDVYIVGGLSCDNPLGTTDLMRGEETQIIGAMNLNPELNKGDHLLCLPGTHTKWVLIKDGVIETFLTALTGELYALLMEHSILIQERSVYSEVAFVRGVKRSMEVKDQDLLHVLFEVRAMQIQKNLEATHAQDYLSGLLIGKDISSMQTSFPIDIPITLIGTETLTKSYKIAMKVHGLSSKECDGGRAVIAGLYELFKIQRKEGK